MNYYERHIGDYLKDTAHLSILEHGVYTRLLDVYYTRESAIPDSEAARLVGARSRPEREALRAVLSEFFTQQPAGWSQDRCDREISRYKDKQEKAKRSADARWDQHRRGSDGNASAVPSGDTPPMRPHSGGNAPQSPSTSNHLSEANASGGLLPPTGQQPDQAAARPAAPSTPPGAPAAPVAVREPLTLQDQVFATGIALLTSAGLLDRNARSFLAMQLKAHAPEQVLDALNRCAEVHPVQPVPWLVEALKQGPARGAAKDDRKSRQLETAALMTAGAPAADKETLDVESRVLPS